MDGAAPDRLELAPITLKAARAFVREHHRHHRPPAGGLFALAATRSGRIVGVAIVGRPSARNAQDGRTAEVTRLCTDGTPNACSLLYGWARRAAQVLGYRRLLTYTLPAEGGASLRASGWTPAGRTRGGRWSRRDRARADDHPLDKKDRWEAPL